VSVAEGKIQKAYNCTWFDGAEQHFGEFLGEALVASNKRENVAYGSIQSDRRLISSKDVQGANVYGVGDERIGEIDHLVIEMVSGRIAYAIMSFGGFLGLAHSHYPIPWSALTYDAALQGYRTRITESQLRNAPTLFDDDSMGSDWEARAHRHYDAPTYWGSTTAHQRSGSS
jgi:hypothetical protein